MFDLHNERCEAKKGDLLFVCVLVQREEGGERGREREREGKREWVCEWACLHPGRLVWGGLEVVWGGFVVVWG